MTNKDGGGDNFKILWGDTAVMRGDIELMGDPQSPPLGKTLYLFTLVLWLQKFQFISRINFPDAITNLIRNSLNGCTNATSR